MSSKTVPFGKIEAFNVLIEIPKGSQNKYEYNEDLDKMELEQSFTGDFCLPFNYGFIPQTKGGDGDCLDAFVISSQPISIGTIVKCRAIGIIKLLDRGEQDDKVIAVALADPEYSKCKDIGELSFDYETVFKKFFKELSIQENKIIELKEFAGREEALREIKESRINEID